MDNDRKSAMEEYGNKVWKDFLIEISSTTCKKCGTVYYEDLKYDTCQHCIDIINSKNEESKC
tara:strand:- start:1088 stop:1273 length:186 start_codon:yes stop_codon:yes gene_type:complete